jgi:hypothetical protein
MKSLQLITALSLLGSAAFAGTATSGNSGKGVQKVAEEPSAGITGSVTVGYDSSYYFRGLWFSNNNVYSGVNLSIPVADKLTLGLGALYTDSVDTDITGVGDLEYSELDLVASLTYDAGFAKFGAVFTSYQFFDTFSGSVNGQTFGFDNVSDSTIQNATDFGLTVSVPVENANLNLGGWYDFKIDAFYFEAGVDYTLKLTEWLSLVPAAQIGYGIDYYTYEPVTGVDDGFTHVRVGLSAPIKAASNVTITPYIAANFSLEARELINTVEGENDVFGGVSVSVSF